MAPESNAKAFKATVGSKSIILEHCPSTTQPKQSKSTAHREATPTPLKSPIRALLLEDRKLEEKSEPPRGLISPAPSSAVQLAVRETDGDECAVNIDGMGHHSRGNESFLVTEEISASLATTEL